MQSGEPILRSSKAKDLLQFAGIWQGDDFEECLLGQQQHQKPSLAKAFAELREICAEENYHLEVPPRHNCLNPFVESPHDFSL